MKSFIIFIMALRSLGANKLRATLALLGIVIGIAAVISLMSLGRGVQDLIVSNLEGMGTNLIFLIPSDPGENNEWNLLTLDDMETLIDTDNAPNILDVAAEKNWSGRIVYSENRMIAKILGITDSYYDIRNLKIDKGIFLTDAHMIQSSKVIVIGSEVVNTLFDGIDPIGKYLKISSNRFLIIGVMEEQDNTFGDQGINKTSYIPLNTMYESLSPPANLNRDLEIDWIMVKAIGSEEVSLAMAETAKMIRLNHRIVEEDDFLVTNQQEILESLEVITNAIIIFLTSIAAVSLLVGGIGIMNIMLVTVTERTREIGIRKALGATRYDILLQFVIESVLLTATGGLIGMLLGYGVSHLLNGIPIGDQFLTSSFTMEIAMLALSVSVSIGLFFGIFPAYRASKLHPIDALRYQ